MSSAVNFNFNSRIWEKICFGKKFHLCVNALTQQYANLPTRFTRKAPWPLGYANPQHCRAVALT